MQVWVSAGFRDDGDGTEVGADRWKSAKRKIIEWGDRAKPLQRELQGCYRVTVGDWRCVYEFIDEETVLILALAHRSEVYDLARARRTP